MNTFKLKKYQNYQKATTTTLCLIILAKKKFPKLNNIKLC